MPSRLLYSFYEGCQDEGATKCSVQASIQLDGEVYSGRGLAVEHAQAAGAGAMATVGGPEPVVLSATQALEVVVAGGVGFIGHDGLRALIFDLHLSPAQGFVVLVGHGARERAERVLGVEGCGEQQKSAEGQTEGGCLG